MVMKALDHVLPEDTRHFPVDTWHFLVAPSALEPPVPCTYQVVNKCLLNKSAPTRKLGKWSIFLLKICRIDLKPCTILIC